jgi:peptide/nickel transport system permease protein
MRTEMAEVLDELPVRRRLLGRRPTSKISRRFVSGMDLVYLVIGSLIVASFVFLALFPSIVAPYEPFEEAGPRMLSPGAPAPGYAVLAPRAAGVSEVTDLPDPVQLGVLAGIIDVTRFGELWEARLGDEIAFLAQRFRTVEDLVAAAEQGAVQAIVVPGSGSQADVGEATAEFETLIIFKTKFTDRSFLIGTDQLGRDVFSRVVWGTRVALIIGLSAPAVSAVVGLLLGITSAYLGGNVDRLAAGVMDALYSLPVIVVAVALAAAIGPGLFNLIIALSVVYAPTFFRLARSRALSVKNEVFIDAVEALGAGRLRVIDRHIMPNAVVSVGVFASLATAQAIRTAATLSFLGLGLGSGRIAEWGSDIARAQQVVLQGPWLLLGPGIALSLLVFGLTLMSDVIFENLNPRLRRAA